MSTDLETRLPPRDPEAETLLIGGCLRDPDAFDDTTMLVRAADFSSFANQKIWTCFVELASKGIPITPVAVGDWAKARKLEADVSAGYIASLYHAGASSNFAFYAKHVRKKAQYREIIRACELASNRCYDQKEDPNEVRGLLEQRLLDIGSESNHQQPIAIDQVVIESLELLDKRKRVRQGEADGDSIMSGWKTLDDMTGGFFKSEMTVIAARPSVGKTLVALCIADFAARSGNRVLFASIEQRRTELAERLLSRISGVSSWKFRTADFNSDEEEKVSKAVDILRPLPIYIDDPPVQDISRISSAARRMKMRGGLDILIIDYLQKVFAIDDRDTRNNQVAAISRGIKRIARELNIPVIALAQVNRRSESGPAAEAPKLSDLRESGDIEQDADTVIMLHKTSEMPDMDPMEFHIRKQRNGPRGMVILNHYKKTFDIREPSGSAY